MNSWDETDIRGNALSASLTTWLLVYASLGSGEVPSQYPDTKTETEEMQVSIDLSDQDAVELQSILEIGSLLVASDSNRRLDYSICIVV